MIKLSLLGFGLGKGDSGYLNYPDRALHYIFFCIKLIDRYKMYRQKKGCHFNRYPVFLFFIVCKHSIVNVLQKH